MSIVLISLWEVTRICLAYQQNFALEQSFSHSIRQELIYAVVLMNKEKEYIHAEITHLSLESSNIYWLFKVLLNCTVSTINLLV